jgi:glycerol-3-phosphate dehydrogenase
VVSSAADPPSCTGGVVYYDGQHNDTRMNVLIALTACQAGAAAANYVEVSLLFNL